MFVYLPVPRGGPTWKTVDIIPEFLYLAFRSEEEALIYYEKATEFINRNYAINASQFLRIEFTEEEDIELFYTIIPAWGETMMETLYNGKYYAEELGCRPRSFTSRKDAEEYLELARKACDEYEYPCNGSLFVLSMLI
jgi:hypothetical protein